MPSARRADGLKTWGLPRPLPEELGISLLARFLRNWGYLDRIALIKQALGTAYRVLHGACPPAPQTLGRTLRPRHSNAAGWFLRHHTLVPYVLSSLPIAQAREAASRLGAKNDPALQAILQLRAFNSIFVTHLQFCRICAASDRHYYGEPYWRRLHQVWGIAHCPTHGCRLVRTEAPLVAYTLDQIVAASTALRQRSAVSAVAPVFDRELEAQLATQVIATLRHPGLGTAFGRPEIRSALLDLGYRAKGDRVAASSVSADLEKFLISHDCSLNRLGTLDWPLRLFTNIPSVATPLQHQILVLFLRSRSSIGPF